MTVSGGQVSYVKASYETTVGTESAFTNDFGLGYGVSVTPTRRNNMLRTTGLGSRNVTDQKLGKYEGTLSVSFVVSNSYFFEAVLGSSASAAVGSAYDHTYTEANAVATMSVENGMDMSTDSVYTFIGWAINSCTLSASIGETVKCTLEGPYKTETEDATIDGSPPVVTGNSPFTFAHGTLARGGTLANVQSFELSVTNNVEWVYGLGSRLGGATVGKSREYRFTVTMAYDTAAQIDDFYGADGAPGGVAVSPDEQSLTLTLTNGLAGASEETILVTLTNACFDEHGNPQDIDSVIMENITGYGESLSVVGTDNTSDVPAAS